MKIERLSENQIRCTLNKADLAEKELLLTELAYGTDKAKALFKEMMQQASAELGFEVDEMPLMIEAIPVNPDCLILIITKVENPDELDTRFSRFTRPVSESDDEADEVEAHSEEGIESLKKDTEGLLEALGSLAEEISGAMPRALGGRRNQGKRQNDKIKTADGFKVYVFKKLTDVTSASKLVYKFYDSDNTLYKNPTDRRFYLYLKKNRNSDTEFLKTCNIMSEYAVPYNASYAASEYFDEHFKVIIPDEAVQVLSKI